MNLKSNLLIITALFSVASAQQVDLSNKVRYYTNGLTDAFHLVDLIVPAAHTYTSYADTSVCQANDDTCDNPNLVVAYQISYGNLGSVYACFCDNAVFNISYMADNVGRVPYRVRQNVVSYTAASVGKGSGAYAVIDPRKIVFFDQNENTEVFVHESGHIFDYSNGDLSQQNAYYAALNADGCVPDSYAATNDVEDFAQLTVTWVYLALTNQQAPACLSQSIAYMASVLPASTITSELSTYGQTSTSAPTPTSTPTPTSPPSTSAPTPTSCTIAVRQTLSNTWQSGGVTYSQYDGVFTNNGASDVQANNFEVGLIGAVTQVWNLEQQKNGEFILPSYQTSIAAGQQYTFGYVIQSSSPANIVFDLPSTCSSTSTSAPVTSAPTSAPVTSAPVTSAPTSAPVTSAPVTSAPVTSAPVTSAPTTSAPTTAPGSSCSDLQIQQTQTNSWVSDGNTYTQWSVVYSNLRSASSSPVVQLSGASITQIWNVNSGANGYYYLPSYQTSIAGNQQYTWGYIVQSANPLTISVESC